MQYAISFLEGIITFISPCLLPMLPIYVTYFAGGSERSSRKTLGNACGFVLGFTLVFTAMGALAGTLGGFLTAHQTALNIVSGLIVIVFGLNYLGVLKLNLFFGNGRSMENRDLGFFSALLFGCVSGLRADAGFPTGSCAGGHFDAARLLSGPGHSVYHQRCTDRSAERRFQLDQEPLPRYQHGVWLPVGAHRYPDGYRPAGPLSDHTELRGNIG